MIWLGARAAIALAAGIAVSSCSQSAAVENGTATDEGIAQIALPEEQLRFMLGQTVFGSQSGPMALYALGLERGCEIFEKARDQAVDRHLPTWRKNLVDAYRGNVPSEQLAEAVGASPRAAQRQLASYLPAIASAMQRASAPLLTAASVEIVGEMSNEAGQIDRNSIVNADRRGDLERMSSEGKICGVGRGHEGV